MYYGTTVVTTTTESSETLIVTSTVKNIWFYNEYYRYDFFYEEDIHSVLWGLAVVLSNSS